MKNLHRITDILILDIFMDDYPDLVDAYVESGWIEDRPLTEAELDDINTHHSDWVQEKAREYIL